MGQSKLKLSEDERGAIRKRVNEINRQPKSMPPKMHLPPGKSNIGRNKAKALKKIKGNAKT